MTIQLGAHAAPGFDDPLEMLLACHGRIQAQCDTLLRLVEHLRTHGNDTQAGQAARAILRYFDSAGRHHHHDEEQDLFPQLNAANDPAATVLVARLLEEHKILDAAWHQLRMLLNDIAEDQSDSLDAAIVMHFNRLYENHIALENSELLPLARALLNEEQLHMLGRSMAARRGVTL